MADYIHAIVKYPAMYKELRKNGLEEIANIKWEYAGQKVREIYEKVKF
jgi:glycosyltransferase involved in cell wall biosynthesis